MENGDGWLTVNQAAEMSGYHPEHIRRLIREGEISARKFSIVWQVNRQSLLDYVQRKRDKKGKR